MDCGPSCLAMIAEHYGRTVQQELLHHYCSLGRNGVSLLGISKAAENIGFKTVGGRLSFDILANELPFPCIVHWNQNHFVVVYNIRKRKGNRYEVYVADPGKGLVTYTKEEFCEHWVSTKTNGEEKGIALLLEPTEQFYAQNEIETVPTQNRLRFLWNYLKKYKRFFTQLILGLLLGSLLQLVFPFLTQAIVDTGIGGKDIGFVWLVLLAQMMLLFSRTAIDFIRSKILLHISTRINISLISDFFIKLMKLPMKFFDTKLMGDLLQRIEDHQRVEQFLTSSSLNLLFSFFTFLVFGVVLAFYNLGIFAVFLIGTILYASWIILFLNKRRQLDYKYFEQAGRSRNVPYQLIAGMQEIKLQGCEQRKRWEWEDVQADLFKVSLESLNLESFRKLYKECDRSPYHPRMMLKVILYAYMNNIYSCRKIEKLLHRDIHYIWLAGYEKPDFITINRFRNRVKKEINEVFTQTVLLLSSKGFISLNVEYIDGTKIESKANKYTFVWRKTVERDRERLMKKIHVLLGQIDDVIAQENSSESNEEIEFTPAMLTEMAGELRQVLEQVPEPSTKEEKTALKKKRKQLKELEEEEDK